MVLTQSTKHIIPARQNDLSRIDKAFAIGMHFTLTD